MSSNNSSKIRVLIVDDSRVVRVAAAKMFGDEFEVILAVDGADGLRIVESDSKINVVFTDLAMPEMDGFELLKAIRHNTREEIRELPVVVATGAGNTTAAKQKAFSIGATDFISKPFHGIDLKARARSYARFQEQNKHLKEQVTIDELTGLMNLKGLRNQLEKEISFVARHDSNITIMNVEIDNYKDLFVRIGREGTEKLITRVASVFEGTFRKEDSVSRSGLARFTISLPMSEPEDVMELSNRICHTVEAFKATLDGHRIKITVSIGVSSVKPAMHNVDVDEILGLADESLEQASSKGASQIQLLTLDEYRDQLEEEAKRTISIDKLLEQLSEGNEVNVVSKLDAALVRLSPLFELMSNEHYQHLFEMRQHKSNNVFSIEQYQSRKEQK